jgi:hypothetical protein
MDLVKGSFGNFSCDVHLVAMPANQPERAPRLSVMFPATDSIPMVEEAQPFLLTHNCFAATAKQVLQCKRSADAMSRPVDDGDTRNSLGGHQLSRPAAGAVGIGE